MSNAKLPTKHELAWPTLKVLEHLGGSASIKQITSELAEFLSLPDESRDLLHGRGRYTELEYRAAWARTYLKKLGAVENPSKAMWRITNLGRGFQNQRTLLDALKNATQRSAPPPSRPVDANELPTIHELAWPTLNVLKDLGGTASIKQIFRSLAQILRISPAHREIRHGDGQLSEFGYRAHRARSALRSIGVVVENASNGIWSITDSGRGIPDENTLLGVLDFDGSKPECNSNYWKDELIDCLQHMKPSSFQSLCKQVLIRSDIRHIKITNKAGTGDILGSGLLRINLVSFHILFQFKRSTAPVDDAEVRDLRGAMMGRAEKGLFVTTGKFTDSASQEALRNGAPVIDLINGFEFCDLLKDLELGVSTKLVEVINFDPEYFRNC